jgi:hypothetical protein
VLALGEAYAFGVVWSFVFNTLAMIVLRFKDPAPREFKVPLNIRVGRYELPVGIAIIFLILLVSALLNLVTKPVATEWGLGFTGAFLCFFLLSERYHTKVGRAARHEHLEQFTMRTTEEITAQGLGLTKPNRVLVCLRSSHDLHMLERVLKDLNPQTTDLVLLYARVLPHAEGHPEPVALSLAAQRVMTAVVDRAEKAGKEVRPLVVETNDARHAILYASRALQVQEVVLAAHRPTRLTHRLRGAAYKPSLNALLGPQAAQMLRPVGGQARPVTIRVIGHTTDWRFELGEANPIPKPGQSQSTRS